MYINFRKLIQNIAHKLKDNFQILNIKIRKLEDVKSDRNFCLFNKKNLI